MRLIDADALMELVNNHKNKVVDANDIARFITIEAAPVRHGRWLTWEEILHVDKRAPNNLGVFCSMCNKHSDNMTNYCPVCGAEMDGGEKNEDISIT